MASLCVIRFPSLAIHEGKLFTPGQMKGQAREANKNRRNLTFTPNRPCIPGGLWSRSKGFLWGFRFSRERNKEKPEQQEISESECVKSRKYNC